MDISEKNAMCKLIKDFRGIGRSKRLIKKEVRVHKDSASKCCQNFSKHRENIRKGSAYKYIRSNIHKHGFPSSSQSKTYTYLKQTTKSYRDLPRNVTSDFVWREQSSFSEHNNSKFSIHLKWTISITFFHFKRAI